MLILISSPYSATDDASKSVESVGTIVSLCRPTIVLSLTRPEIDDVFASRILTLIVTDVSSGPCQN